jgi:hypothetical protein
MMPLDGLEASTFVAQNGNANKSILVICQSGTRAAKASQRLQKAGLKEVYCIEGGTAAWEKSGLPFERGKSKVISLERQVRIGAASLVLLGVILACTVHPAFLATSAFVGAGLVFAGITDYRGMGIVLSKMPWNR